VRLAQKLHQFNEVSGTECESKNTTPKMKQVKGNEEGKKPQE